MCFFAGGTRFSEQGFGMSSCSTRVFITKNAQPISALITGASQLNSSLLTLSVIAVLLPAAFHSAVQPSSDGFDPLTNAQEGHDILAISHGASDFFSLVITTADTYSTRLRSFYSSVSPFTTRIAFLPLIDFCDL